MNFEWIAKKSTGLMAIIVALGLIAVAFMESRYRFLYICCAVIALIYGFKQFKKRDTPFEKRERELKRKTM